MARIRTIKPEFFYNKELSACTPHARLLAIALLQLSDCKGRIKNIPMQIHSHSFPWESKVNIQSLLGELSNIGYIIQYHVEGNDYISIPKFLEHQRLQGKEVATDSKLPEPTAESLVNTNDTGKFIKPYIPGEYPIDSPGITGRGTGIGKGIGKGKGKGKRKGKGKTIGEQKPDPVLEVFQFWQKIFNHPGAALDDNRKKFIALALKLYSAEDCKKAIIGCSVTPHNIGDNDRGQKYDGIHIVFKDADQIDRFIFNANEPPSGGTKTIQRSIEKYEAQGKRLADQFGGADEQKGS